MKHIFVIDDDANIRQLILRYLEKEGYKVTTFENAEALAAYATHPKHVAVADSKVRPYTANRACMDFEV